MERLVEGDFATEEQLKIEAIDRMKKLGLANDVIEAFNKDNILKMSENGIIKELENEEVIKIIKRHGNSFKEKFYHVIHSFSNIGETYECLMVSPYLEDWYYERDMLKRNIVYCYAINITFPENTEAGSILVENYKGALVRTA